jgi:hypothetical protein
MSRVG